jgi:hypothetical protein
MKHVHIPAAKLYSGQLRDSLEAIWTASEPEIELQAGGDRIAVERIAEFL